MLIDLHAKTNASEGVSISPRQLLQHAQKAGLNGVALCETERTARCPEILELAASEFSDLSVFIGVEIATDRGILLGFAPYIDDFYLNEEWAWLTHSTTPAASAVIEVFDEQDGVVIAARPYDLEIPFNMGDYIFEIDRIGGVEVFTPRVGRIQQNFALEAATFMGLGTTGGSDPSDDPSVIGKYATFFEEDLSSQRLFVDALRDSEFWAVQIGEADGKGRTSRKKSGRNNKKRGRNRGRRRGRR